MKIFAEIVRNLIGYEIIAIDGVLIADCDIDEKKTEEKLGEIIGIAEDYGLTFRVYQTFAGLRPICVSHFFRTLAPISKQIMLDIGSDPRYVNITIRHKKFAGRITPKPERVGVERLKNFYALLPRDQEAWVKNYTNASTDFKTCNFILQTSDCEIPEKIQNFIDLHEKLTGCHLNLPLA